MSSQRGNITRTRTQKHQNKRVFKNDLHDTNVRTKRINQIQITRVCDKCKAILEWKIKYKKYKLMKAPKSCNKCDEKAVKQPYHTICQPCADRFAICPKCATPSRAERRETLDKVPNADQLNESTNKDISSSDSDDAVFSHSESNYSDSEDEVADKMSKVILIS